MVQIRILRRMNRVVTVCLKNQNLNKNKKNTTQRRHARIQKVFSEGVQLFSLQIQIKSGHHRPASEMSFKRRFAGPTLNAGFVIFRGSGQVLLRNPIFLWFFRGGGVGTPCPPSGSAHGRLKRKWAVGSIGPAVQEDQLHELGVQILVQRLACASNSVFGC